MKRAFTMIELVFVIVIIGILAMVAIPKLATTRDDAKVAVALQNLTRCIVDIGNNYTTTSQEGINSASDGSDSFSTCNQVKKAGAFVITGVQNSGSDGNITVSANSSTTEQWQQTSIDTATKRGLLKTYSFAGTHVVE